MEKWENIEDFEGYYMISTYGKVKSLSRGVTKKERILSPSQNSQGNLQVVLCKNGTRKTIHVRKLVMTAFKGVNPGGKVIGHLDGENTNVKAENLYWTSRKNARYSQSLSPIQVKFRDMKNDLGLTNTDIARITGHSPDSLKTVTQPHRALPQWARLAIWVWEKCR